jgi:hypothetical protein
MRQRRRQNELSLEEQLAGLHLTGEELADLDFLEEIEALTKDVRWPAVFKLHWPKPFSHARTCLSLFKLLGLTHMKF